MAPPDSLLLIFLTSAIVGFSGAVTPGPLLAFNVREVLRPGSGPHPSPLSATPCWSS